MTFWSEIDGLYDSESYEFFPAYASEVKNRYKCKNLCDLVKATGSEVRMEYGKDFYKEYPVVTRNCFGQGNTKGSRGYF